MNGQRSRSRSALDGYAHTTHILAGNRGVSSFTVLYDRSSQGVWVQVGVGVGAGAGHVCDTTSEA